MRWEKLGLVYVPTENETWAQSYAYLPTAEYLEDLNIIRVYYASLDINKMGRVSYMDLNANNPLEIVYRHSQPILNLGEPGTFDDSGVSPSCILSVGKTKYLYYIGWQRCERVPYMLFAGLAVREKGGAYKKLRSTPVLDRIPQDPFLRSATSVLYDNKKFRCWYVSANKWVLNTKKPYPQYIVRYTESSDGIHWDNTDNPVVIDFENSNEYGFGRPHVIKENNTYKMWYSVRSLTEPYKIGYAESKDGINWVRKDELVGIHCSKKGWDSEMICFPYTVDVRGQRYMFYNGNQHGKTGFGVAVLE